MKKILVTGSLGQLGSFVSENLIKKGFEVVGLDNETNRFPNLPEILDKVTVKGDISNKSLVDRIMKDVDAVVHCAAQISILHSFKDPVHDANNNILGTATLLQSAIKSSVERFVYISSAAIYGNPIDLPIQENHPKTPLSPYGLSKFVGELYSNLFFQIYKLPIVIIRPFNIYSKRMDPNNPYSGVISKFIGRIKNGKPPIIFGDGRQTRDFVHVKDVVKLIDLSLKLKDAKGEIFNCGFGKPITINYLAEQIIDLFGKNFKPIYKEKREGDIKDSYADISKAKNLLNFEPKIDLREGLKEIISDVI